MAAEDREPGALAKFGPIGAPALGAILMIAFIAIAFMAGDVDTAQTTLVSKATALNSRVESKKNAMDKPALPDVKETGVALGPEDRERWAGAPESAEAKTIDLPLRWVLEVESPELDEFQKYDEDKSKYWDEDEFRRASKDGEFAEWDKDGDGKISREEFEDPPVGREDRFKELDVNGDGVLTEGEISAEDVETYDRSNPRDGKVTLEEWLDTTPKAEFDLAAPTVVDVRFDAKKMEIVVTWTEGDMADKAPDLGYIIERYSPETLKERQDAYGALQLKHTQKLRDWKSKFEEWWKTDAKDEEGNPVTDSDGNPQTWKELYPRRRDAEDIFIKTTPRPVSPPKPSDWEVVNLDAPINGTEYRDTKFKLDVSYRYAVRAATRETLKPGVSPDKEVEGLQLSARVEQTAPPIRIRDQVEMAFGGRAGSDAAYIDLKRWHRLKTMPDGAETAWVRVKVRLLLDLETNSNGVDIGDVYGASALKDLKAEFIVGGQKTDAGWDLLDSGEKVDFTTDWRLDAIGGDFFVLINREDRSLTFDLPADTRKPMAETEAPTSDNPLQVSVYASSRSGAVLHVSRWVQVENEWYRVLHIADVKKGKNVGATVKLSEIAGNDDFKVFTSGNKELSSSDVKDLGDVEVVMEVGEFKGVKGRTLLVGDHVVDLFGVLYLDE